MGWGLGVRTKSTMYIVFDAFPIVAVKIWSESFGTKKKLTCPSQLLLLFRLCNSYPYKTKHLNYDFT